DGRGGKDVDLEGAQVASRPDHRGAVRSRWCRGTTGRVRAWRVSRSLDVHRLGPVGAGRASWLSALRTEGRAGSVSALRDRGAPRRLEISSAPASAGGLGGSGPGAAGPAGGATSGGRSRCVASLLSTPRRASTMPSIQRGTVGKRGKLWAARWSDENGVRRFQD